MFKLQAASPLCMVPFAVVQNVCKVLGVSCYAYRGFPRCSCPGPCMPVALHRVLLLQNSALTPACVHSLHATPAFAWYAMAYALLKVLPSGLWCEKLYVGRVGLPKSVAHCASGCCASRHGIIVCQANACAGRANS